MLLPCDQPYLRAIASQRPTYPISGSDFLPFDVERALAKLLHKEAALARKQELLKQEIAARYDFNVERLFKEVDDWNYKFIDHKNLKRFLNKMGVPTTETHLIAIIRRFDLDADAKLSLSEFA
jgi:EF-hand domain pair